MVEIIIVKVSDYANNGWVENTTFNQVSLLRSKELTHRFKEYIINITRYMRGLDDGC